MVSNGPRIGEPYNFDKVGSGVLIPRVIVADTTLLPGARLLWGLIRQRMFDDQPCNASDLTLARELGVTPRAIRKYDFQLQNAGLLVKVIRPGGTTLRALCWASRFNGTINLGRPEQAFQGYGTSVPGGRNKRSSSYKEDGVLRSSNGQSLRRDVDSSGLELRKPGQVEGDFTRLKAHTFDADEHAAIVGQILSLELKPTPALMTRLSKIAGAHKLTGYAVAAIIARAAARVRHKPSLKPQSAAWVSTVVESEAVEKTAKGPLKSGVAGMQTAAELLKSAVKV